VTLLNWQTKAFIAVPIAAMLILGLSAIAGADAPADGEDRPINIDVRDMEIGDVLRMLGKAANENIIVGRGVSGNIGSLTLRNVSVETALKAITESSGFYWRKDGNIYIVTAEPPAYQPAPQAPQSPRGSEPGAHGQPPGDRVPTVPAPPVETDLPSVAPPALQQPPRIITQLIPLSWATASEVAQIFGGRNAPSVANQMDGRGGLRSMPGPGSGGDGLGALGVHRSVVGSHGLPQFDGGGAFGGGIDAGVGDAGVGGFGAGTTTGTTTGTTGTTTGAGAIALPGEMEPPVAIMSHNALLVRGTREELDEFREMLAMLDIPQKQVEIATKWVDVQTTAARALGIDWAVTNGAWEIFNLGFAPGEAANNGIRYGRGRWWAELAVLENTSQATVINEPRVVCMNGMPGTIAFATEIPYFAATISFNQFGQRTVDYTSEFVSVSNELSVVPQINPDDSVKMLLAPQLEDQIGTVEGPNGERIPIVTTQFVETMVRVADGETVVLGGVIRSDESTNVRRTPLLSDIPIIGRLFESRRVEKTSTELLIFVTPKIIRDASATY
jgi:type II secretory pathway component GspD/PulD (secretin)